MTSQLKENNLLSENEKHTPNTIKPKAKRPNIDHLIKRILVERRKETKKTFIIFALIIVAIGGSITISL